MVFLSHPKEEEKHILSEHCLEVAEKARNLSLQTSFGSEKIAFYAGLFHDIGKINPYYQKIFNANQKDRKRVSENALKEFTKQHALFSALLANWLIPSGSLGRWEKNCALMVIASHHSGLSRIDQIRFDACFSAKKSARGIADNLPTYKNEFSQYLDNLTMDWDKCFSKWNTGRMPQFDWDNTQNCDFSDYLRECVAFSAVLQADRGSFYEWKTPNLNFSLNTEGLVKSKSKLAYLRSEFQKRIFSDNKFGEKIMVLEAPTGIGKTKIFLDIINNLKSKEDFERVFYFSPLLALTEDFESKLFADVDSQVINPKYEGDILIYNHLFSGTISERRLLNKNALQDNYDSANEYKAFGIDWFERETFNKKFVITTTQRLLMTLFSNRCSDAIKLISFKNSLLIVDEVQTIPKFLLPVMVRFLTRLSEKMNTKVLLVSATIPDQIASLPKVTISHEVKDEYLKSTLRKLDYVEGFNPVEYACNNRKNGLTLVMVNTRKKAAWLLEKAKEKGLEPKYLSSGIRKRERAKILAQLKKNANDELVISTQVVEAGVDISFSRMFRECAPLDNIVQAMGRLNREAEATEPPTLTVFTINKPEIQGGMPWMPYSELEYCESVAILKKIKNSVELYASLPKYYKTISDKKRSDFKKQSELEQKIRNFDFDGVWDFVRKEVLAEEYGDSILVPDYGDWEKAKAAFLSTNKKSIRNNFMDLFANLPKGAEQLGIGNKMDEELMEKGIYLPKKEFLQEIYDPDCGFDKWLIK